MYLYRYDLSNGQVKAFSPLVMGRVIEGIWHTSVVVFGKEFYFGSQESIVRENIGETHFGTPVKKDQLGTTTKTEKEFLMWIETQKKDGFGPDDYHLLKNNCNDFTQAASTYLVGTGIPEDVRKMIPELMNSRLGQLIGPMLMQAYPQSSTGSSK